MKPYNSSTSNRSQNTKPIKTIQNYSHKKVNQQTDLSQQVKKKAIKNKLCLQMQKEKKKKQRCIWRQTQPQMFKQTEYKWKERRRKKKRKCASNKFLFI